MPNATAPRRLAGWLPLIAATIASAALGPRLGAPGAVAMAALLVAALAAGLAGFAFSALGAAMLCHCLADPVAVTQVVIICAIANQGAMTWSQRRAIDWRGLGPFLAGGAAGLPLGVWLLLAADRRVVSLALAALLLGYGGWRLARPRAAPGRRPGRSKLDPLIGVLGGITGGACGFAGAPLLIWCGARGWDAASERALCQPFALAMQLAALAAISLAPGHHGLGVAAAGLLCVPASLLGTMGGLALYRRLPDRARGRAGSVLLLLCGAGYAGAV